MFYHKIKCTQVFINQLQPRACYHLRVCVRSPQWPQWAKSLLLVLWGRTVQVKKGSFTPFSMCCATVSQKCFTLAGASSLTARQLTQLLMLYNVCMHIHMHVHPHACTSTCMCMYMHNHMHVHTQSCIHIHMHVHPHACTSTCMYMCIHYDIVYAYD